MEERPKYNWDEIREEIEEEEMKAYARKQTIRGIKRFISIVLATGIATTGALYFYKQGKREPVRANKQQIEELLPPRVTLQPTATPTIQPTTLPTQSGFVPKVTVSPVALKEKNSVEKVLEKMPNSAQMYTTLEEFLRSDNGQTITSYAQFEKLLASTQPEDQRKLAEEGLYFFIQMERKLIASYIADSNTSMHLDKNYIKSTYERNQNQYQFHIRYTDSEKPITIARPKLERSSDGTLSYIEGTSSNLPIALYERIIFVGENNRYRNAEGTAIDLEKYAAEYTNGDVNKAIILIGQKLKTENDTLFQMLEEKYSNKEKGEER